jgi:hypothetical protein
MSRAVTPLAPRPFSQRVLGALPIEPACAGAAVSLALLVFFLVVESALGTVRRVLDGELDSVVLRATAIPLVLIGYIPTAQLYLARWTRRHVEALAPLLSEPPTLVLRAEQPSLAAGLLGFTSFLATFLVVPLALGLYGELGPADEGMGFTLSEVLPFVVVPMLGWLLFRFLHALVADAAAFSRLAAQLVHVPLLDPRAFAPFADQGTRAALLVVLLMALTAPLTVGPGPQVVMAALLNGGTVAIAVSAFLLPARGVRVRIAAEKARELGRVRGALADAQAVALAEGAGARDAAARLPGLIALERRLDDVREWPFDTASWLRLALYVALGLGSWVGGALMERLVALALI